MIEIFLRVVLGIVLAGAALAKLTSARESMAALSSFGFESGPIRPIAWATLIATELVLGVAVALGSDIAAYAAAALLVLFAALTAGAMIRGRAGAPCACFGPRSTVSWLGVGRNLALAGAFAIVPSVDSIHLGADGWLGIGIAVSLLTCAGLAVAVLALAREVGMLRLQLGTQSALEIAGEGPAIGSREEQLSNRIHSGAEAEKASDGFGLAVFTSEACHLCQTLAPAIENIGSEPHVSVGVFDEVADAELWRRLSIPGSPFALALDRSGVVLAKGTFNSLAQLESVLATAERRRAQGIEGIQEEDPVMRAISRLPIGA
jgi:Methylamine utilisation protein MauE